MGRDEVRINPTTKIENIVATVILDQTLDLNLIESKVPNVTYQPDQFPGLILRLEKPKTTALIFKSGKMVVTGAKSTQQLIEAVKKIIKLLRIKDYLLFSQNVNFLEDVLSSQKLQLIRFGFDKDADLRLENLQIDTDTSFKISYQETIVPFWIKSVLKKEDLLFLIALIALEVALGFNLVEISQKFLKMEAGS